MYQQQAKQLFRFWWVLSSVYDYKIKILCIFMYFPSTFPPLLKKVMFITASQCSSIDTKLWQCDIFDLQQLQLAQAPARRKCSGPLTEQSGSSGKAAMSATVKANMHKFLLGLNSNACSILQIITIKRTKSAGTVCISLFTYKIR